MKVVIPKGSTGNREYVATYSCNGTSCTGTVQATRCTKCNGTGHGYCRLSSFSNKANMSYWCNGGCGYVNSIVTSYCASCGNYFEWFLHKECGNGIYRFGTKLDQFNTLADSSIYLEQEFRLDSDELDELYDGIAKGEKEISFYPNINYHLESCSECDGNGVIYKCNICSQTFSELPAQHCAHGYTSQHD